MPTKLPAIVHTDYRRKRPPKLKTPVAILMSIVSAKKPDQLRRPSMRQPPNCKQPTQPAVVTGSVSPPHGSRGVDLLMCQGCRYRDISSEAMPLKPCSGN